MKDRLLTMTEAILGSTLDCSKPPYKRTRKKRKSEKEKKKKKEKKKRSPVLSGPLAILSARGAARLTIV